ncbi:electron transport complex subunit RsxG [Thalassotalea sp. 1_MG-2023]|uniref:electron transport complex subunit RsxG n=1 Tax=Thalassotalea sp. 1_MG-2023 TaxID=3062680 RepID=UPI0026E30DC9|nr:electron transport complex subunit RsxG [Thalassotalea sp. 1_MG-2023]MDO6426716.1 electron transport complex subunit RsxG [Thalassotalea sp. 1_MG-2023]
MRKAIEKNAKLLAIFAIACTALVAFVDFLTRDTIAQQQQQNLIKSLAQVVNSNAHSNNMSEACVLLNDESIGETAQKAYLGFYNEQPSAIAMTITAPDGYNGNITLLIGMNIDGMVTGIRTLSHQETPGLGDKIEQRKSDWVLSFDGKSLEGENDPQWAVKKDGGSFDQFTGATITPRAIVNASKRAIIYFKSHKNDIFTSQNKCQES